MGTLISTRDISQSLDIKALEDACGMLEEERSGLHLTLQDFNFGSTFQAAIEALVINTSEVEEEEDKILSEIATETRRLERLELKVSSSSASRHLWLRSGLKIQAIKSHMKWRKEEIDGQCNTL